MLLTQVDSNSNAVRNDAIFVSNNNISKILWKRQCLHVFNSRSIGKIGIILPSVTVVSLKQGNVSQSYLLLGHFSNGKLSLVDVTRRKLLTRL